MCGLPKVKKTSNRTNADIEIHFGLNDEVPFSYRLTNVIHKKMRFENSQ